MELAQRIFLHLLESMSVPSGSIMILGSPHGKKAFVELPELKTGLAICAGAGEDVSFDIELASRFSCEVLIVDPTPRAKQHFLSIQKRFGSPRLRNYGLTGKQEIDSYDLSGINDNKIFFIEKALWCKSTTKCFYPPANSDHVSYSLTDLQKTKIEGNQIIISTTTIKRLLETRVNQFVALLKLDVEGSAFAILRKMFQDKIYPQQIILEFDEFIFPSFVNYLRAFSSILMLKFFGYKVVARTSEYEVTFLKKGTL